MTATAARAEVAYLGPRGTFSEAVARDWSAASYAQTDDHYLQCFSIDEVFLAVEQSRARYGVVPVENSTEGAVNNTLDCLMESALHIVGERIIPVRHCLFAATAASLKTIRRIASHPQSLAQCRKWLRANCPQAELQECASNAQAARLSRDDSTIAAVAGAHAGEIYQLQVLAQDIQDQAHNSTRFLILGGDDAPPMDASGKDKTAILTFTENRPGALFRILQPFAELQISMTRLESRPSRKEAWAYVFFIDFEGHQQDKIVKELFRKLQQCTAEIKILGSFANALNDKSPGDKE